MTWPIVVSKDVTRDLSSVTSVSSLSNPPDVPQVLQDDIVGFVSHHPNLAAYNPVVNYTASAPEMISINSFVIIAWRVRL